MQMIAFGKCITCMGLKGSTDNPMLMDSSGRSPFWGPAGPLSMSPKSSFWAGQLKKGACRGCWSWRPEPWWRSWRSLRECPPWWEHKLPRSESQPGDELSNFGRVMLIMYLNLESWVCTLCMNRSNLLKKKSTRTYVDKVCSLWPLNLDWDVQIFLHFRLAVFPKIRFVFLSNHHFLISKKSSWDHLNWLRFWPLDGATFHLQVEHFATIWCLIHCLHILVTRWSYLHWLQIWPPGGTTCISCKLGPQVAQLALVQNLVIS